MSVGLGVAAVLALATNPRCGAAQAGTEFAWRLTAIAIHESGGDPYAIGVNGLGSSTYRFATQAEAMAFARALNAAGRDFDAGLMQINRRQLARYHLTLQSAFDACSNMAAGAVHYAADVQAVVFDLAHRRYNTGSIQRGAAYAASVEQVLAHLRAQTGALPASPLPASPSAPPAFSTPFVRPQASRSLVFTQTERITP